MCIIWPRIRAVPAQGPPCFAEEKALQKGHGVVRLDAQRGNEALNAWYARQGYRYVGLMREGSYEGILREKRLIRNTSC